MASTIFERAMHRVPAETQAFVGLSADILDRVQAQMEKRGMSETDLARELGVSQEELAPMLSLGHNFTLRTLTQLQTIFGETLITVADNHATDVVYH